MIGLLENAINVKVMLVKDSVIIKISLNFSLCL